MVLIILLMIFMLVLIIPEKNVISIIVIRRRNFVVHRNGLHESKAFGRVKCSLQIIKSS